MATQAEVTAAASAVLAEIEAEKPKAPEPAKVEEPKAEPPKAEPAKEEPPKAETPEPEKPVTRARKADLIPAVKFHEVRHELAAEKQRAKELEERIAAIEAERAKPQAEDPIEAVAKKHGLEKEVIADIAALAKRDDSTKDLEARLAAIESAKKQNEDEISYRSESDRVFEKFPELKTYAKDLKDMAYTAGNESIPLEYLALKLRQDMNLGQTVAPAEGASAPPAGKGRDLDNLSEADLENLSSAELDKLIKQNRIKR